MAHNEPIGGGGISNIGNPQEPPGIIPNPKSGDNIRPQVDVSVGTQPVIPPAGEGTTTVAPSLQGRQQLPIDQYQPIQPQYTYTLQVFSYPCGIYPYTPFTYPVNQYPHMTQPILCSWTRLYHISSASHHSTRTCYIESAG